MANESNLKVPTSEQAREYGARGGKASAKAKKEKKLMKEQMAMLLSLPLQDERTKEQFKRLGINVDDLDNQMALVVSVYQQALKGNMSAVNQVREIIGEKVIEVKVENSIDDNVKDFRDYINARQST